MKKLEPLVAIVGPTAAGKTEVGVRVARKIQGEVISGDSRQVYREMDIGTGKPTREEMNGIPHYLLDIISPDEDFSVARFQRLVEDCLAEIRARDKIPVLVGGTGLYIRSVLDYYDFTPPGGDSSKRKELLKLAEQSGNEYLVRLLREVDPAAARRVHPNDTRRLVRALEVYHATGRPISDFQYTSARLPPKYNLAYFGLTMNRPELYRRIEERVDGMLARGLVGEVKKLVDRGYGPQNTAMQALGYKEIMDYLKGRSSLEEAVVLIKRNTRQFAKRQLTWFRQDERIKWKNVDNYGSLAEIADEIAVEAEGQFGRT